MNVHGPVQSSRRSADAQVRQALMARRASGTEADQPEVSVVLPTLNERAFIRDCLDSLLRQDYPAIREILVVDGGSTDGTRELLDLEPPPVRALDNPKVTAAAAMNAGIRAAKGEIVVRADAHTLYAEDYVRRCVEALLDSGAAVVGGCMRPVGTTSFGRAVAAITASPFGIGPGRFHYADKAQDVDTVYLGAYRPATVLDVGGYDEDAIQWGAEDQELNFRIRKAGGRIRLEPSIRSMYFPRSTPAGLWRQYANYGMCKASTLKKHRTLPYWRPTVPAALVAAAAAGGILAITRRKLFAGAVVPLAYATGAGVSAVSLARDPGVAPHRALVALTICHWSYGVGFWRGIGRILTNRRFDVGPRGGRR